MRLATTWASTLLACATVTAPAEPAPPVESRVAPVARPPAPEVPDPARLLAARGVYHDDFVRPILYTWTTARQVAALRETRRLLVAEASAGAGPSLFLRELAALAERRGPGHELATALLEHPALIRRRYAWPNPYATTMGLGPIRYGDALIRVELDPRAIVLRFRPGDDEPLTAVDMQGRPVALAQLDPTRVAAVYHVRDGPREQIAYREYVLCNESMIAAWSVATPELRATVDADITLLASLADGPLAQLPDAALRSSAAPAWARRELATTPIDHWHASLAFDNARYRPSRRNLAAIVATLRGYDDGGGEPLRHGAQASQAAQ